MEEQEKTRKTEWFRGLKCSDKTRVQVCKIDWENRENEYKKRK